MTYDPLGRVITSQQTTAGQAYNFSYGYNSASALTSETYPSGRVLTTGYDPANRATGIAGTLNAAVTNYAASATYAAHGGLAQVSYGNTLVDNYTYNNRLQVLTLSTSINGNPGNIFLWLAYNWGTTNNNGTLQGMEEYNGGLPLYPSWLHFTQTYLYDGVNRLGYALDSGSSCSRRPITPAGFGFISTMPGVTGGLPEMAVFRCRRRRRLRMSILRTTGWVNALYDASGNQRAIGGMVLAHDAESRESSATNPPQFGGGTVYYQRRDASSAVEAGMIDNRILRHDGAVHVNVGHVDAAEIRHGAIVGERSAAPLAAYKADSAVAESVIDAAIEPHVRTPVAGVPSVSTRGESPVPGVHRRPRWEASPKYPGPRSSRHRHTPSNRASRYSPARATAADHRWAISAERC